MSGFSAKVLLAAAASACVCGAASAASVTYGFSVLENNSPIDLTGQLSVTVSDHHQHGTMDALGAGQVSFRFDNIGSLASSICDVYFDDGTLLGIATIHESSGVNFSQGGSPPNLPGGSNIGFQTTAGFLADSDAPAASNGVNATVGGTEWVEIVFNLINGKTYADTIAALNGGDLDQDGVADLRIGIHMQALGDGRSETYVNGTPPPPGNMVPLPSTAGLAAAGLLLVGTRRRR